MMLHVSLPETSRSCTLQELVDNYFDTEIVEDVACKHCRAKHDMTKGIYLESSSEYLLIHLKRFEIDDNQMLFKKENKVEVDATISMQTQSGNIVYTPIATMNHEGSLLKGGHYTIDKLHNGDLFHINDSTVNKNNFSYCAAQVYVVLLKRGTGSSSRRPPSPFSEGRRRLLSAERRL